MSSGIGVDMDARDIQRYLSLVGRELKDIGVGGPVRLLMIGGGYMLTQVKNRATTGDVDMVWVYPEFSMDSGVYWSFEAAVRAVGEREALEPTWLNVAGSDFVREAGPLPKMRLWKKFGPLHVCLPPKDFILAHKLVASRRKDMGDIAVLCAQLRINSRDKAQQIVDKYISREIQRISHVPEKLDRYFGR
jgi:hypothetical protein